MTTELPWHHIHITLDDRQAVAEWHDAHTLAVRREPTKRSENLMYGPNLLQVQGEDVARAPRGAWIDALGLTVTDLDGEIQRWVSAGATVAHRSGSMARLTEPWQTPFELIEGEGEGLTHINILAEEPDALASWYCENLLGALGDCEWDTTRTRVQFDTLALVFCRGHQGSEPRILDHLGWFTSDLDGTFARLNAGGVEFPVLPREFGSVRLAFGQDPCGIWFELLEPPGGTIIKPA